ncbi:hypothetical protein V8F06_004972 [Rhypophila decipiens]
MSVIIDPENPNLENANHAHDTWTCEAEGGEVHWVKDFIPLHQETSRARVLVFEYNSLAAFEQASSGVEAQAENLLGWLWENRRGFASRLLIFIAHSFGGLIVKEALVQARTGGGKFASICVVTRAVTALTLNPVPGFLRALDQNNGEAERLHDRFATTVQGYYRYVSVYETLPHKIKALGVIVPRLSALLGLSDDRETRILLNRDHGKICKFSSEEEPELKLVFASLTDLCNEAIASLKHPTNFSARERQALVVPFPSAGGLPSELDSQLTIEEAIRQAQNTLESAQTVTEAVNDIGNEIHTHLSSTKRSVALVLIPVVLAVAPILMTLSTIGLFFGAYLVPAVLGMITQIANGLENLETEQAHVSNLSRLNIQILDDNLQRTLTARKNVEEQLTTTPTNPNQEAEERALLTRLNDRGEHLLEEMHKRQPVVEGARLRVQQSQDFRKELTRVRERQEEQDEFWIRDAARLAGQLLPWLFGLLSFLAALLLVFIILV